MATRDDSPKQKPVLELHEAKELDEAEPKVDRKLARLSVWAYGEATGNSDEDYFTSQVYPENEGMKDWWTKAFDLQMKQEPDSRILLVVDTANDKHIVGYAKWVPHGGEGPHWPPPHQGQSVDALLALTNAIGDVRQRVMGNQPHAYFELLAVHPKWRRLGIAGMLVKRAIELAQQHNWPLYVEASPSAQSMYKKHGFVIRDRRPLGEGFRGYEVYIMVYGS